MPADAPVTSAVRLVVSMDLRSRNGGQFPRSDLKVLAHPADVAGIRRDRAFQHKRKRNAALRRSKAPGADAEVKPGRYTAYLIDHVHVAAGGFELPVDELVRRPAIKARRCQQGQHGVTLHHPAALQKAVVAPARLPID